MRILGIVLIVLASFYVGFVRGEQYGSSQVKTDTVLAQSEHQTETQWEYIEVPVPVIREVVDEVFVKDIVYSEVPDLKFFRDKAELQEWVQANLVEDMGSQKCVAESLEMQRRAIADGYQVGVQAMFEETTQPEGQEWELVVSAFTELGSMYYIWPTTGMVRFSGHSIRRVR